MENKYLTLKIIHECVKDEVDPTSLSVNTTAIILRHHLSWPDIVIHLGELEKEGLITMKQLSTASISITKEGIQKMASHAIA